MLTYFFFPSLGVLHANYPSVTEAVFRALRLCVNLYSFTWVDDKSASPAAFLSFLDVLRGLPLRAITLRTYSDLGEDVWALLNTFTNLQKVAIWCMTGPPRVLQGWAPLLGSTLTELDLGVCIHFFRELHHCVTRSVQLISCSVAPESLQLS